MARGFESKQVEHQQAEAERRRELPAAQPPGDPAQRARRRSLELARVDAGRRLDAATAEPLRLMLTRTLQAIDRELAALADG